MVSTPPAPRASRCPRTQPGRALTRRASLGLALLAGFGFFAACQRDGISYARVPKESALTRPASMSAGDMTASPGEVPAPPAPAGGSVLKWTLPKGWTQTLGGTMRYATLKPEVSGRLEATVVVLPGPAGGELANVNRWRGQIGLPPIDEAALSGVRRTLHSKAGPVSVYDFTSEGEKKSRTIAGLALVNGSSWFVKLSGDAGPVDAARTDFIHLLESLHLEE